MRKAIKLVTTAILALSLIFALSLTASAADNGNVIYENDFSDSDELDETMWYPSAGTQEIVEEYGEKFIRCYPLTSGTRASRINFGPNEAKNIDIDFRLRARDTQTASDAYCGLYFRSISIPSSPLFAYQLRFSATKAAIAHVNNHYDTTTNVLIEDANTMLKPGLWYNIRVSLREKRIVVYVNGQKIIDIEDDSYPVYGGVGLCSVRYTFDVDDIVMVQYSGKKLPEPTANEVPIWVGAEGTTEDEEFIDSGEERLNLFGGTAEKVSTLISGISPNALTVGKIIAICLLALVVLFAVATVIILILFVKKKKKTAPIEPQNVEEVPNQ